MASSAELRGATAVQALYHVPRSQVWQGSRGRQTGHVHLHVHGHGALCGRWGWYERPPLPDEASDVRWRCPRCVARADRLGIVWPGAGPEAEGEDG